MRIRVEVDGRPYERDVEPRTLLSDFLRRDCGLTGTHVGCEHGVCGACTVQLEGEPVRSCLLLAVQADGRRVRTVEGLAGPDGALHPLQEAFRECHTLQCGFCTPGLLLTLEPLLPGIPRLSDEELRVSLAGNLCRCTGYAGIVDAARRAAAAVAAAEGELHH